MANMSEKFKNKLKDDPDFKQRVDQVLKENFGEELSDEELGDVSGGGWGAGPSAPNGHEVGCWSCGWYDSWNSFYSNNPSYCKKHPNAYSKNGGKHFWFFNGTQNECQYCGKTK